MAKVAIDLSGKGGLVDSFQGDLNDTTSQPHLRYEGGNSQVADGIYDPLRVAGFMSPANDTFLDITGTITNGIISRVYSSSADTLFLAEDGTRLATMAGFDATALTQTVTLPGSSYFKDLELYEMNATEAVLYSYVEYDPTTSTQKYMNLGFKAVDPNTGAFPLAAQVYLSLTAEDTASQTITSTTNQALAQKFSTSDFATVSSFPVSGIRVRLNMPFVGTTQSWTLRVGIQTDSGGFPSGTYVSGASADITPSNLPVSGYDFVYATFASTVSLSAGTTYHVVVEPTSYAQIGTNEGVYWLSSYNDSSQYANGEALRKNSVGTWEQASIFHESYDFALVLNSYNYIGETEAAITIDQDSITVGATTGNNYTAAATTLSTTQTVTSLANPVVIAAIYTPAGTDVVTGVTCGGVAMTRIYGATETQFGDYIYIYALAGVSAGSKTVTLTGSSNSYTLLTAAYYGVNQTVPFSASGGTSEANTAAIDAAITPSGVGQFPIMFAANNATSGGTGVVSGSASAVLRASNATGTMARLFDSGTAQTTTATYTMTFLDTGTPDWLVFRGTLTPATFSDSGEISPPIIEGDGVSFLQKADNGFMYWITNNRVHKLDGGSTGGTMGRVTPDVLVFPDYLNVIDAVDTNSLMYLGVQSTSTSGFTDKRTFGADTMGIYQWDRQSTVANTRNFIPIYGAREIRRVFVNADGDLRVITIGEDGFTEIRGITNGRLQVFKRLGREAYPARRDSVDTMNNLVTWLGADGVVYALGKLVPGASEALYKIGKLNGYTGTLVSGVLISGNESAAMTQGLLMSWTDNSSKKLQRWYPHGVGTINGVAQLGQQGNVYSVNKVLPYLSDVHHLMITCAPYGQGGGSTTVATLKFYKNMETTPFMTKTVTRADIKKGYLSYEINKSYINAFQIEVEHPTDQTLGSNDFLPAFAVLDYTATPTIK
jgi:hypothetical protein